MPSPRHKKKKKGAVGRVSRREEPVRSRHGSWAGRGYRYQDAFTAHIALLVATGRLDGTSVVPEGADDVAITSPTGDRLIQIKSRRASAREVSVADVASYLHELWERHRHRVARDPSVWLHLVLERIPAAWHQTGWSRTLADPAYREQAQAVSRELIIIGLDPSEVVGLLARTSLVHEVELGEADLALLRDDLGLLPQACVPHLHALTMKVGALASENGDRQDHELVGLSVPDVRRLLDEVTSVVDINALGEALTRGLCHHVDFTTPLVEPNFYLGVDAVPGHVAAGLVVPIPELVDDALNAMVNRRQVLVVGPSGSGKSALAWLTARRSADAVLWFRSSRLLDDDVPVVVRLLEGASPGPSVRVGLVVDNLGREETAGWDRLVREVAHRPNVMLLGVVRQEDLIQLESASQVHLVRPHLTEPLAKRIWERLQEDGRTSCGRWQEPYSLANGLVLEYVHLLTGGERLQATIDTQMRARLLEPGRDTETRLLRLVSVAHVCGLGLPVSLLSGVLGVSDDDVRRAMSRCINEHLVRLADDERLRGLHELRSKAIIQAAHEPPPPRKVDTVVTLVGVCPTNELASLCAAAVHVGLIDEERLLVALRARLTDEGTIALLAAALRALYLIGAVERGQRWNQAMDVVPLAPTYRSLAATLALTDSEPLPMLKEEVQTAIRELRKLRHRDRRGDLLAMIKEDEVRRWWGGGWSVDDAIALLAGLVETGAPEVARPGVVELAKRLHALSLATVGALLDAARRVDLSLAVAISQAVGGESHIRDRLSTEVAWLRDLDIGDDGGTRVLKGRHMQVTSDQGDAHAAVVDACRLALAVLPTVDRAEIIAADASGKAIGYGDFVVADKKLTRRAVLSDLDVRLNRELLAATSAAMSRLTVTARLTHEAGLLNGVDRAVALAAEDYLRRHRPSQELITHAENLVQLAEQSLPASIGSPPSVIDERKQVDLVDPVVTLAIQVSTNLIPRLFAPDTAPQGLLGYLSDNLSSLVQPLTIPERWALLSDEPVAVARRLLERLDDVHATLAEQQMGGKASGQAIQRSVRVAPTGRALPTAAKTARQLGAARLRRTIRDLERHLMRKNFRVMVATRAVRVADSTALLPADILVLVHASSMNAYYTDLDAVETACREVLGQLTSFFIAPVRKGKLVAGHAQRIIQSRFPQPLGEEWVVPGVPPRLEQPLSTAYQQYLNAAVEVSGLVSTWLDGDRPDSEEKALTAAAERFRTALNDLHACLDLHEPIHEAVDNFITRVANEVQDEADKRQRGSPVGESVGGRIIGGQLHGFANDLFAESVVAALLLTEWEVQPEGAQERVLGSPDPVGNGDATSVASS